MIMAASRNLGIWPWAFMVTLILLDMDSNLCRVLNRMIEELLYVGLP